KPAAKKKATAGAANPAARKSAAAKAPAPESAVAAAPEPVTAEAPALVNAAKPDEKLDDTAFVALAVGSVEKSLKAAVPAAVAVNSKLVDFAQANMNSGMELARDLAGAKSPMEMMRLSMAYWHENMGVFRAQAQELQTLSASLVTKASEPIR